MNMSSPMKLGVYLILGALGLLIVVQVARSLLGLVLPLAIVGGVGLILYSVINRKALGGGKRYLP